MLRTHLERRRHGEVERLDGRVRLRRSLLDRCDRPVGGARQDPGEQAGLVLEQLVDGRRSHAGCGGDLLDRDGVIPALLQHHDRTCIEQCRSPGGPRPGGLHVVRDGQRDQISCWPELRYGGDGLLELGRLLVTLRGNVAKTVAGLPDHAAYVARYCGAADAAAG